MKPEIMKYWKKLSQEEIKDRVFGALSENINFNESNILGIPGSNLDEKVFYQDAPFLKDAPFLSTLVYNPNHIGCHTLGTSEHFFKGTQQIEQELIKICAEEILKGKPNGQDGYVASGGTEANMQAIWIYRNYFRAEYKATNDQICILCSEDSHYSMAKAANVFNVDIAFAKTDENTRQLDVQQISELIDEQKSKGKKYFIVVANMMTTMFGSVDNVDIYVEALQAADCPFKLHVDGAYGGFFYPFSNSGCKLDFSNPHVTSVTLDAHKMVQAPYGTGLFLIRKDYIHYANTKEASYVEGEDFTLIGSRSGANAVAVWMILMKYGPYGWKEKILILLNRANWVIKQLEEANIEYYRNADSNIITIKSKYLTAEIADRYGLVPDNHHKPRWYKIVIMEHVIIEKLLPLINELKALSEDSLAV